SRSPRPEPPAPCIARCATAARCGFAHCIELKLRRQRKGQQPPLSKGSSRLQGIKASSHRRRLASLLLTSSPSSLFSGFCNGVKKLTRPKHLNSGTDKLHEAEN